MVAGLQNSRETHLAECDATLEVHYCAACGCIAREVMKWRANPCSGVLKRAGIQNLARIRKKLQPGSSAWAQVQRGQDADDHEAEHG
eukprot:6161803-Pyramimonas_sp.AAC.1